MVNFREISREKSLLWLILLAVITCVIYLFTLCPTIYVGDSGELVAASWTFGIPHSPGYPLFTFLGYFFAHAPVGDNPALRMNFMTALFGILSVLSLYWLTIKLTKEYVLSFFASLIFAFGLINWSQCVTTEVYSLNNLVVCLTLLMIVTASESGRRQHLYTAAFLAGCAFTTHQTSLLILPAAIWFLVKTKLLPLKGNRSIWIYTFLFYFLGLCLYLYLPIASSRHPLMNWGNPSNPDNFIKAVFTPVSNQANNGYFYDHLVHFFKIYFNELTWIGALLSFTGIGYALSHKSPHSLKFLSLTLLTYVIFFLATLKPSYESLNKLDVYYLPVFMIGVLFIPEGVLFIIDSAEKIRARTGKQFLMSLAGLILAMCMFWNVAGNFNENNRRGNYFAENYGKLLLDSCDENSILMCNFDDLFILFYQQHVLKYRQDVSVVLAHFPKRDESAFWAMWLYEQLFRDPGLNWTQSRGKFFKSSSTEDIIETFIGENIDSRAIFFTFYKILPLDFMEIDYRFEPTRLCYRVRKFGQSSDSVLKNYDYYKNEFDENYFITLFEKHNNIEESFILVRFDEVFKFDRIIMEQIDEFEKAYYFAKLSTDVNPWSDMNWWSRSILEGKLGKYQDAINSIEKIVQLEFEIERKITPGILDMRYEQARLYHESGDNVTAADILNQFYPMDARRPQKIKELAKEIENALADDLN